MKSLVRINRDEFYRQLAGLTDPYGRDSETILLCANAIDMMRYRLLLHENVKSGKTLFHVEFLTLDHWLRKSLPLTAGAGRLQENELIEKLLLTQILEKPDERLKHCRNLAHSSGFFREIIHLWRVKNWYGEDIFHAGRESDGGRSGGRGDVVDAFVGEIIHLLKQIDLAFQKNDRISQAKYMVAGKVRPAWPGAAGQNKKVALLFPGHLNLMEKAKLQVLENLYSPQWFLFIEESLSDTGAADHLCRFFERMTNENENRLTVNQTKKQAKENAEAKVAGPVANLNREKEKPFASFLVSLHDLAGHGFSVHNFNGFQPAQAAQKNSSIIEGAVPASVVQCESDLAEAHFIARSLHGIRKKGVASHQILVLAGNDKLFLTLPFALSRLGISAEGPGQYPGGNKSYLELASLLLEMLELAPHLQSNTQSGDRFGRPGTISSETIRRLLLNDHFNRALVAGDAGTLPQAHHEKMTEYRRFVEQTASSLAPMEKIGLFELRKRLRKVRAPEIKKSKNTKNVNSEALNYQWVTELIAISKKIKDYDSVANHTALINEALNLFAVSGSGNPGRESLFQRRSLEFLKKLFRKLSLLDSFFPRGVSRSAFMKNLRREISGAMLPMGMPGNIADENPNYSENGGKRDRKDWIVSIRSLEEGLRHPVSYLFIGGLTNSAFPKTERVAPFLPGGLEGYSMKVDHDQQMDHFFSALHFASEGVTLSYSPESDVVPSKAIFSFFDRAARKNPKRTAEANANEMGHQERLAHLEKYDYRDDPLFSKIKDQTSALSRRGQTNDRVFSGKIEQDAYPDSVISATALEHFSACPQLYWFRHLIQLWPPAGAKPEFPVDRGEAGSLFHMAAKEIILHWMQTLPGKSYAQIMSSRDDVTYDKELNKAFHISLARFQKQFSAEYFEGLKMVFEARTDEIRREVFDYFMRFRRLVADKKHPLAECIPVGLEKPFDKTEAGGFSFRGRIDRIDYNAAEKTLIILDYKTGKMGLPLAETTVNETTQLPLYVLALSSLVQESADCLSEICPDAKTIQAAFLDVRLPRREMIYWGAEGKPWQVEIGNSPRVEESEAFEYLSRVIVFFRETLDERYFFAIGRKKDNDPRREWEPPCRYCEQGEICDRKPFEAMLRRLQSDPLGRRYLELFGG